MKEQRLILAEDEYQHLTSGSLWKSSRTSRNVHFIDHLINSYDHYIIKIGLLVVLSPYRGYSLFNPLAGSVIFQFS